MNRSKSRAPVLVVEDDPDAREALRDLLEVNGYAVETAENGAQALARLENHLPALVLTDLRMPVMDGWELVAHLRREPRYAALPVAVLTAEATAPEGHPSFQKPADPAALLDFVRRTIGPPAKARPRERPRDPVSPR